MTKPDFVTDVYEMKKEIIGLKNKLEESERQVKELENIAAGLCKPEGNKADEAYDKWLDYQKQLRAKLGGE